MRNEIQRLNALLAYANVTINDDCDLVEAIADLTDYKWVREKEFDFGTMAGWATVQLGKLAAFAFLWNRYNRQVCNGGHWQYVINGYACGQQGSSKNLNGTSTFDLMRSLFTELDFGRLLDGAVIVSVLNRFPLGSEKKCDDEIMSIFEHMDTDFYKVEKRFQAALNVRIAEMLQEVPESS